jgi:hypothetical protein
MRRKLAVSKAHGTVSHKHGMRFVSDVRSKVDCVCMQTSSTHNIISSALTPSHCSTTVTATKAVMLKPLGARCRDLLSAPQLWHQQ